MSTAEAVLSAPPYQVPDSLRQRLDLIHHLLEFGRQIIVVSGAPGSGRTRLLEAVAEQADPSWRVIQVDAMSALKPLALLHALNDAAGTAGGQTLQEMEEQFAATLERGMGNGTRCLLLLDDVDDIDDDCAGLLCRLAYGREEYGGLRVVAAALPGATVIERLEALAPHPALVHVVDVPPLSDADVANLIEAWCEDNRLPLEAVIDTRSLVALQAASNGNPGRALELLARHMAAVPPRIEPVFSTYELPPRVKRVGGIAIVACAALALIALALGNRETSHETSGTPPDRGPKTIELALPLDDTAPPPNRIAAPELAHAEAPAKLPPATDGEPDGEPSSKPPPASERPVSAAAGPPAQEPPRPDAVEALTKPAPTPVLSPPPASRKAAAAAPVATADSAKPAYSPAWIRAQDKKSFVIQLFGSHSRNAADKFVSQHAIAGRAAILDLEHEGRPWYVVVYGHYTRRSAATQAIAALPAALRTGRPWPRAVGDLGK